MRNIGKYADNVMNVMRENAHILYSLGWVPHRKISPAQIEPLKLLVSL